MLAHHQDQIIQIVVSSNEKLYYVLYMKDNKGHHKNTV